MEVCLKKLDRSPSIVESCRAYKPTFRRQKSHSSAAPPYTSKILVRAAFSSAHEFLRRSPARSGTEKPWGRRGVSLGEVSGYYCQEWRGEPADITTLLDNLEEPMARKWLRVGLFRDLEISEVFFHELGTTSIACAGRSTRNAKTLRTDGAKKLA